MNSREVEGGKVLPGAMGMSSSVNRWRTFHRAVARWIWGGTAAIKKIIENVNNLGNVELVLNDPLKGRRELVKEKVCNQ